MTDNAREVWDKDESKTALRKRVSFVGGDFFKKGAQHEEALACRCLHHWLYPLQSLSTRSTCVIDASDIGCCEHYPQFVGMRRRDAAAAATGGRSVSTAHAPISWEFGY